MKEYKPGAYLRMLRLLSGLQQSEVAEHLATSQATLAQLEAGRYKISPFYIQTLSDLFHLSPEFLSDLTPPAFSRKVTVFSIEPGEIHSKKILSQMHQAIRDILPAFCVLDKVDLTYSWSRENIHEWSTRFSASLFLFFSSEFGQLMLIKVREGDRGQFLGALRHACEALPDGYEAGDLAYGEFERLFTEEFPTPDEEQVEQFGQLLQLTEIPGQGEFVTAYSTVELNEIVFDRKASKLELDYQRALKASTHEHLRILEALSGLMDKHGIGIEDIAAYRRGKGSRPR